MTSIPSARSDDQHPIDTHVDGSDAPGEVRAGELRRVVLDREVEARCDCGRIFDSTGTAASHARATRHAVTVDYRTRFAFIPLETLLRAGEVPA